MRIVATFGVWDLFHIGHLNLLERAKGLGCCLIVGIATDELVESYKHTKPVIPYEQRERIIKALKCVNVTLPYSKLDITELLKRLHVDILVVGEDWGRLKEQKRYRDYMLRKGKIVVMPYTKDISTTQMKERIQRNGT